MNATCLSLLCICTNYMYPLVNKSPIACLKPGIVINKRTLVHLKPFLVQQLFTNKNNT
jgi:hypothetical protein